MKRAAPTALLCCLEQIRHLFSCDATIQVVACFTDSAVIKSRRRANAVSLTGLFATWVLELIYIFIGGFLAFLIKDGNLLREIVSSIIPFAFYFVPLVQIQTSPNIKSFVKKNT